MLFNSIEYLFFLPIVFLLYWLAQRRLGNTARNLVIVAASYVFYGWWSMKFLLLIMFTTLCSYVFGLMISRSKRPLVYVWINVLINLGILGVFKYYDFFISNFNSVMGQIGLNPGWVTLNLVLPVGISFYTFQALSYTIDVYREKIRPTRDLIAFTAFISFFPQLVAGPIERATNLLPQFLSRQTFNRSLAVEGMQQILWGLFKKVVVADNCAITVNMLFADYGSYSGFNLLIGAILFSFQIYGDFSGYSDIAIGSAKLFNIKLMDNFKVPYFSRDIAEFWRRWHISLTSWFRDYIYIPLGGSRCSKGKVVRNTFVIFLLSGFWHGAEWTFIVWGGYHAALFMPLILMKKNRRHTDTVAPGRLLPSVKDGMAIFVTFALATIGWIIFRAVSIADAWHYICRIFTDFDFSLDFQGKYALGWVVTMLVIEWVQRFRQFPLQLGATGGIARRTWVRWLIYYIFFALILIAPDGSGDFIYFQF